MSQIHDLRRIDDRETFGDEVAVGQSEPRVDHHRLAGVQHEGVDRKESQAGHLKLVVEDRDVFVESIVCMSSPGVGDRQKVSGGEQPRAGLAPREDAAELHGVELEGIAVGARP